MAKKINSEECSFIDSTNYISNLFEISTFFKGINGSGKSLWLEVFLFYEQICFS